MIYTPCTSTNLVDKLVSRDPASNRIKVGSSLPCVLEHESLSSRKQKKQGKSTVDMQLWRSLRIVVIATDILNCNHYCNLLGLQNWTMEQEAKNVERLGTLDFHLHWKYSSGRGNNQALDENFLLVESPMLVEKIRRAAEQYEAAKRKIEKNQETFLSRSTFVKDMAHGSRSEDAWYLKQKPYQDAQIQTVKRNKTRPQDANSNLQLVVKIEEQKMYGINSATDMDQYKRQPRVQCNLKKEATGALLGHAETADAQSRYVDRAVNSSRNLAATEVSPTGGRRTIGARA